MEDHCEMKREIPKMKDGKYKERNMERNGFYRDIRFIPRNPTVLNFNLVRDSILMPVLSR